MIFVDVFVIFVGNLMVGGMGKMLMVEWVC